MKVKALENFKFYVFPRMKYFQKGEVLESPTYPESVLESMVRCKLAYPVNERSVTMENKMVKKDFQNAYNKDSAERLASEVVDKNNDIFEIVNGFEDKKKLKEFMFDNFQYKLDGRKSLEDLLNECKTYFKTKDGLTKIQKYGSLQV